VLKNPLLPLGAVKDNAAMEAEPKRKRRWFQFSLRTLLVGVTLLAIPCAYVGWQAKIVRERRALRENRQFYEPFIPAEGSKGSGSLSWIRRLLGDFESEGMIADDSITDADLERCRAAFPEANVQRDRDMTTIHGPGLNLQIHGPGLNIHFRNGKATTELNVEK
jgi:hypothetical protein